MNNNNKKQYSTPQTYKITSSEWVSVHRTWYQNTSNLKYKKEVNQKSTDMLNQMLNLPQGTNKSLKEKLETIVIALNNSINYVQDILNNPNQKLKLENNFENNFNDNLKTIELTKEIAQQKLKELNN